MRFRLGVDVACYINWMSAPGHAGTNGRYRSARWRFINQRADRLEIRISNRVVSSRLLSLPGLDHGVIFLVHRSRQCDKDHVEGTWSASRQ